MTTFKYYQQVVPDGFGALVFEHEVNSDPDHWLSTWGIEFGINTPDATAMAAIAAAWGNAVVDPLMSQSTALVRTVLSDAGGVIMENDDRVEGTVAGPFGPVSNSVIIEKRTATSGRHNRGRSYLPVVPDAQIDENGKIAGPFRASVVTAVEAFRTALLAVFGIDNVVLLHSKGWGVLGSADPREPVPADPGNAPDPTVITHFTSRPIVGTQRRRVR